MEFGELILDIKTNTKVNAKKKKIETYSSYKRFELDEIEPASFSLFWLNIIYKFFVY